jgi:hypothetical protein
MNVYMCVFTSMSVILLPVLYSYYCDGGANIASTSLVSILE